MEELWIQTGMLAATVVLTLITVFAASVNYLIFRSVVDPHVILYATEDRERPTLMILVVENVGKSIASNVRFDFSEPLPSRAWGLDEEKAKPAEPMTHGPLIDGIPNLGPGSRRVINWGQYAGLHKALGDRTVTATIRYEGKGWFLRRSTRHLDEFKIDIRSFAATDASQPNAVAQRRAVEKIGSELQRIRGLLERAARVAEEATMARKETKESRGEG